MQCLMGRFAYETAISTSGQQQRQQEAPSVATHGSWWGLMAEGSEVS